MLNKYIFDYKCHFKTECSKLEHSPSSDVYIQIEIYLVSVSTGCKSSKILLFHLNPWN
jgi:hypothetical protein